MSLTSTSITSSTAAPLTEYQRAITQHTLSLMQSCTPNAQTSCSSASPSTSSTPDFLTDSSSSSESPSPSPASPMDVDVDVRYPPSGAFAHEQLRNFSPSSEYANFWDNTNTSKPTSTATGSRSKPYNESTSIAHDIEAIPMLSPGSSRLDWISQAAAPSSSSFPSHSETMDCCDIGVDPGYESRRALRLKQQKEELQLHFTNWWNDVCGQISLGSIENPPEIPTPIPSPSIPFAILKRSVDIHKKSNRTAKISPPLSISPPAAPSASASGGSRYSDRLVFTSASSSAVFSPNSRAVTITSTSTYAISLIPRTSPRKAIALPLEESVEYDNNKNDKRPSTTTTTTNLLDFLDNIKEVNQKNHNQIQNKNKNTTTTVKVTGEMPTPKIRCSPTVGGTQRV